MPFDDLEDICFPQLTLETDDIKMHLVFKKDYSKIKDINQRKNQLIEDLKDFIKEFDDAPESLDFMKYYDEL